MDSTPSHPTHAGRLRSSERRHVGRRADRRGCFFEKGDDKREKRERSGRERGGGGWEAQSTWGRRGGRLCEAAAAVRRVDAWASLALEIAGSEGEVHLATTYFLLVATQLLMSIPDQR